jgi:hypothetical protein
MLHKLFLFNLTILLMLRFAFKVSFVLFVIFFITARVLEGYFLLLNFGIFIHFRVLFFGLFVESFNGVFFKFNFV